MITNIIVKNVASYDEEGISIDNLNKINFIYGSNGSGKTTISNLIKNESEPQFSESGVVWEHQQELQSLVYNKKFREENFGKGEIEGVFTLGQATKEQIEEIEKRKFELQELRQTCNQKKETRNKQLQDCLSQEESFKETVWKDLYKQHKNYFKEAFSGFLTKEKFKTKIISEFFNNCSDVIEFEELKQRSLTIFGEAPETLDEHQQVELGQLFSIEQELVWGHKIVGKSDVDISRLIQRLNMNDWVNQGRVFIGDDDVCPFCQENTISEDFRKQLEAYFDDSFTSSIESIKSLSSEYKILIKNIENDLEQKIATEKQNKNSKLDIDKLSPYLKTLQSQFLTNVERLNNKIQEPSRSLELVSTKEQIDNILLLISNANEEIKSHNVIVDNYQSERALLVSSVWKYVVEEYREEIESHTKTIDGLQKGVDNLGKQIQEIELNCIKLDVEIKELGNNVTSIEPTINKINATLQKFGFLNFQVVPSPTVKNHYQLQRKNGDLADSSLSEGEITFITFLYFMQLASGSTNQDSISDDRVLIVDDPISSLDSTILFVVSTMLKDVVKKIKDDVGNIKQIIILTHNVSFHKEASFVNGREQFNNSTSYWILRKNGKSSSIQYFEFQNPIQTSYELLWSELRNIEHSSGVSIQNTMRRIIENYFKILGKYGDDDLIKKFENTEEQEICRSLICWINDGSHSIPDDLYIELQQDSIEKYISVFKDIFIHTGHKAHYEMMMRGKRE